MSFLPTNLNNVIQGAVLRNQIAGAKADGKVTTAEAKSLIAKAKTGGVTSSELAAMKQLAAESRNNSNFDAGAKAALNKFVGNSADSSHAAGQMPPAANLPQSLGVFDGARLAALDKHFKKDDGQIGRSEGQAILRNILKDGNISPAERNYLKAKLNDPNVSAGAKADIRLTLSLMPGSRLPIFGGGIISPKWPRPQLPPLPRPPPPFMHPITITPPPVTTAPPPPVTSAPPPPVTSAPPATNTNGSTGTSPGGPTFNGSFPTYPEAPKDPKDLKAQNDFQSKMFDFQQASQNMNTFWQMMQNTLKSMGDTANNAVRNLR